MEDSYIVCHDLGINSSIQASVYAVLDGHGGEWCAEFVRNHLLDELKK